MRSLQSLLIKSIVCVSLALMLALPRLSVAAAATTVPEIPAYTRTGPAFTVGETVAVIACGDRVWSEKVRDEAEYSVSVPQDGNYILVFEYSSANESVEAIEGVLSVNGLAYSILLDQIYTYDQYPFAVDERGDQIRPKLIKDRNWMSMPAYDASGSSSCPLAFAMRAGENTVVFSGTSGSVTVRAINVAATVEVPAYTAYRANVSAAVTQNVNQTVEAEFIQGMSARTIQLSSLAEAGLSPETYGARVYNTIGGSSWQYPGQWLEWDIAVPEDGLYQIAFKYQQNINTSLSAYRRMEIDGAVPFTEMLNVSFPYTASWENKVLGGDDPYQFYLTKGAHTLRLTCVNEPYYPVYEALLTVANDIKELDIHVKGVTGLVTDKQVDTYKIYQLEKYIPDLSDQLTALSEAVDVQLQTICGLTNSTPDKFDVIRYEVNNLKKFADDPDLITKSYDSLTRTQTNITTFAVSLNNQPLFLDTVMCKSPDASFQKAKPNFFVQFAFFIKQLVASFTDDHGSSSAASDKSIEVWVQRSRDYVNLMQQYANEHFTPQTGISVNVNYIPGQDILILANSAGMQPAVVSGIGRDVPFNFALRNAILPLDGRDGYDDLSAHIPTGTMIPYHFNGYDYALPEEVIFNVLFYRQDIFDQYNLALPYTWKDAQQMVPTLQQNNMNFWLSWGDWLTFYYQFQMDPYTNDGLDVNMDNEEGFAIFKYWSELYTKYNFPQRIGSFYQNFRYGSIPVGVSSLQDYFLLKMAAPELTGVWRIAPVPGIVNEDGQNIRWQCGDQRGVMLFKTDAKRESEGWEFIKWWLDTETQASYALDLESAYGQEFRWYSANPEVVARIPWDENDKRVILTQLEWFKGIPYSPGGSYLLEREMKNALSEVVIDKKNYRDTLEKTIKSVRKEMVKTQKEFGFIDENGNVLKRLDMIDVPLPADGSEASE